MKCFSCLEDVSLDKVGELVGVDIQVINEELSRLLSEDKGVTTKGEITRQKSVLENNEVMHRIMIEYGLIGYAYNDKHFQADSNIPDHEKVVNKGHDPYIEAMVGAVFYDSNYDTTKRWILKRLLPLLAQFAGVCL